MWQLLSSITIGGVVWLGGKIGLQVGSYTLSDITGFQAALLAAGFYISTGGYYTLYLVYKTFSRDFKALTRFLDVKMFVTKAQFLNHSILIFFMNNVTKNSNKIALIFENENWTFAEIDEFSNRVANYLLNNGFKKGDNISLFMENRPEYVAIWLGCAKIGVVPALINFNLRFLPLVHSIKIVDSRAIICGAELQDAILDIYKDMSNIPVMVSGLKKKAPVKEGWINMDDCLQSASPIPLTNLDDIGFNDRLMYIYTSGTTGLPKAAIIKHSRFLIFATGVQKMAKLGEVKIYNPLPLYHTAGGVIGMGQVLIYNCTSVIRKKFSASNFWQEAAKHECTAAQYVGEICRYLLNAPPKPTDTQHKVRSMFGNGVRPQIWEDFTKRFNMPKIIEFYGATEGIANAINFEGKPGACGFVSVLFPNALPVRLFKVHETTGELIRDEHGVCIPCKPGEPGEYFAKIRKDPLSNFHGYADKKATQKKIIKDVFRKGDTAFASGDILVMDELGYLYFRDRVGDTFRWRGENVSTSEVEGIVSQVANHKDAVVFGVEVPNTEGRAGMSVIVDPHDEVDMEQLFFGLEKFLPHYARPLFIRIVKDIDTTGTFKLKKNKLQDEGYNYKIIKDKIFYLDGRNKAYIPLTSELYEKIISGKAGL